MGWRPQGRRGLAPFRASVVLLGVVFTGCAVARRPTPTLSRYEFAKVQMGTSARVVVYAPSPAAAEQAARAAFNEVSAVDRAMSDWDASSELSRLNRESSLEVSPPLYEVIEAALRFAQLTDGAFDPSVGPVTALWRRGQVPSAGELSAARGFVDWRRVEREPRTRRVTVAPGMSLDLGGIAKGFAAERALRAIGDLPAMVELGGDLALGAPPPGEAGWRIALVDGRTLHLAGCFVSTSGDAERHVDADGVRYSHIVAPSTGIGLTSSPTVLVIAHDGMTADALSTAISVGGQSLIDRFPCVSALLVHPDGRVEQVGDPAPFR